MTPHHDAPEWRGQCGNEQAVITPRNRAGDRARGTTTQTIGYNPLAIEKKLARHVRAVPRHRSDNGLTCFKLPVHQSTMPTARISPVSFFSVDVAALSPERAPAQRSLPL